LNGNCIPDAMQKVVVGHVTDDADSGSVDEPNCTVGPIATCCQVEPPFEVSRATGVREAELLLVTDNSETAITQLAIDGHEMFVPGVTARSVVVDD